MNIKNLFKNFNKDIFRTYPLTIIYTYLFTSLSIYFLGYPSSHIYFDLLKNISFSLLVTIPLSATLEGIGQFKGILFKKISFISTILISIFFYFYFESLIDNEKPLSIFLVFLSYFITLFFIPNKFKGFVEHFISLVKSLINSIIFSTILILGVLSILFTIEKLFDVDFSYNFYPKVSVAIYGYLASLFFLNSLSHKDTMLYPKFLTFLLSKVFMPLLLTYLIILYTYLGKVILTGSYPKNFIPYLIICYGIFGSIFSYGSQLLEKKYTQFFIKYFYKSLIPLILLGFYSIISRIKQYSLTENRYFILLIMLWFSILIIGDIFFKKIFNKIFVVSLVLLSLIASFGPLSAINMSKFFQKKSLSKLLLIDKKNISLEDKDKIYNIFVYFKDKHSLKDLNYDENISPFDLMNKLGYEYENTNEFGYEEDYNNSKVDLYVSSNNTIKQIDSFYLFIPQMNSKYSFENFNINFEDSKFFIITEDSFKKSFNYKELILPKVIEISKNIKSSDYSYDKTIDNLEFTIKIPEIKKELTFYISNFNGSFNKNSKDFELYNISGVVFVKKLD